MNRPDDELAAKIVQRLDDGVENLNETTRQRLAAARKAALSHYRQRPEPVFGLAWAPAALSRLGGMQRLQGARYLIAVAALVLGLIGFAYWQSLQSNDFSDIDVRLLTDDLPIDAYLDRGFDSWLKRASR
jgi:Protein of unknown function (DUF3619)